MENTFVGHVIETDGRPLFSGFPARTLRQYRFCSGRLQLRYLNLSSKVNEKRCTPLTRRTPEPLGIGGVKGVVRGGV